MLHLLLPHMVHGAGACRQLPDELSALNLRHPLLVTDRGIVRAGLVEKVTEALGSAFAPSIFDGITENPVFTDVDHGIAVYRESGCDCVIALGGGSVIDAAKYIALIATNGGSVGDYTNGPVPHRRCAPLIVIPTTAGTGSEASPDAGIHPNSVTASVGMNSRHIVPDLAILDPELTLSLPPRLTAATGIDAISHCVEGFLSIHSSSLTDTLLLDGIRRAIGNLRILMDDPGNLAARSEMQIAAFVGGIGIHMGLGPAHAIAIACGDQGFHHGVLSGIGMVATLDALAPFAPERMEALREAFHISDGVSLSLGVASFMREVGLPTSLAQLGYRASDYLSLGERAHRTPFNLTARHHFAPEVFAEMIGSLLRDQP